MLTKRRKKKVLFVAIYTGKTNGRNKINSFLFHLIANQVLCILYQ
jgi:hypothetical protein